MTKLIVSLLIILSIQLAPLSAHSDERITAYDVKINVLENGVLDIVENITVIAEHIDIRRGIYRDFPIEYSAENGGSHRVDFELLGVERNRSPEKVITTEHGSDIRIYIGDPDNYIAKGEHTYRIHYRTGRQLTFLDNNIELYFNPIPHGFAFPIDHATVRVSFPNGAKIQKHKVFTGEFGSTESHALVLETAENQRVFDTTQPLDIYEGMTIVLAVPNGVIQPPSQAQLDRWFWSDYGAVVESVIGLAVFLIFLFVVWWRLGKDPEKGTIIPRFKAPVGISPAICHFLVNRGFNSDTFSVALLSMAVKGQLNIAQNDDVFTLSRASSKSKTLGLSKGERAIYKCLFNNATEQSVDGSYNPSISSAYSALKSGIKKDYEGECLVHNRGYIVIALIAMIAVFCIIAARNFGGEYVIAFILLGFFGSLFIGAPFFLLISGIRSKEVVPIIIGSLFLSGPLLVIYVMVGDVVFYDYTSPIAILYGCIATAVISLLVFALLIGRPTEAGRKLLDEIEGFRWYLTVAERDEIKGLTMPTKTPQLYERYLPYALALGVENSWTKLFAEELSAVGTVTGLRTHNYQRAVAMSGLTTVMCSSFSHSLGRSVNPPPSSSSSSSSSGFSSGGSSGGGGGGGGGGGW